MVIVNVAILLNPCVFVVYYISMAHTEQTENIMESIVSLCKRRGFIFPGSDIYGGLSGTYDYGPLGSLLKNNIRDSWLRNFVHSRTDMYLVDAAILMNQRVWQATGHTTEFIDPLIECSNCNKRMRVDHLVDEKQIEILVDKHGSGATDSELADARHFVGPLMREILIRENIQCLGCKKPVWGMPRVFNMMLETRVGAASDSSAVSYLRPETAQGIFVNYKNIIDTQSPVLPFGIAQVGKAFRNEITPRDFIFRLRELEQMEIEYFIRPEMWQELFAYWIDVQKNWMISVGIDAEKLHQYEHPASGRAHYSLRTVDWEFEFAFGTKELTGLAYRTDFDLRKHTESSGTKLDYFDEESKTRFTPHCIEPSFGLDRLVLAVLTSAYKTQVLDNGDIRTYLSFAPSIAPYKICVSPLLRNKPELVARAQELFAQLKSVFLYVVWDDSGNIGKRYRRQDEIGTPYCVVVDFDTLEQETVTVRDRDTGLQETIAISDAVDFFHKKLAL
jgi:glycyl-tRNA synthetase